MWALDVARGTVDVAKNNKAHVGTGMAGLGMAGLAIEAFQLYSEASDKAEATLNVALDKAAEAGGLQQALDTCLEIISKCVQ